MRSHKYSCVACIRGPRSLRHTVSPDPLGIELGIPSATGSEQWGHLGLSQSCTHHLLYIGESYSLRAAITS